ncbi:unnamed protein product [Diabrotica balteata]|uniref:Carboxylesterase type B domain-containing protein n=1 Tax=Diabrotica balteata TaxID=107213 RepID=A0A9N9X7Y3_DIABA|nr:unnamed protein product [Diabrotica balteata]
MFGSFERIFLRRSSTYLLIYVAGICLSLAKDFKTIIDIPNQGKLRGVELSKLRIQKIIAYYGIPYAQAPVNNLRFAPPVTDPLPAWDGVKNDTEYAPSCLQTEEDYKESEKPFLQLISKLNFTLAEDCLYLNVFIPYAKDRSDDVSKAVLERNLSMSRADAKYHDSCYKSFLKPNTGRKIGCPQDETVNSATEKMFQFIETSDDCQFSLDELRNVCQDVVLYDRTIKIRLKLKYGSRIIITEKPGKLTFICFIDNYQDILSQV